MSQKMREARSETDRVIIWFLDGLPVGVVGAHRELTLAVLGFNRVVEQVEAERAVVDREVRSVAALRLFLVTLPCPACKGTARVHTVGGTSLDCPECPGAPGRDRRAVEFLAAFDQHWSSP